MSGWVVILNGAPRSGKTSIARAMAELDTEVWVNHGVDAAMARTPLALRPGVGLRPGGERPDLEVHLPGLFAELYVEVARLAESGSNVAVDAGHHDDYSVPLRIVDRVAGWLDGRPTVWVGVRCDLDEIMRRRDRAGEGYVGSAADAAVPAPILRWERAVHRIDYDLEVDTTATSPRDCASRILRHLGRGGAGPRTGAPPRS